MIFNSPLDYIYYVTVVKFNVIWFIHSIIICGGIWVLTKYFWMDVYQFKYGGDAGMDYLRYGKEYCKIKYSSGKKGKKK